MDTQDNWEEDIKSILLRYQTFGSVEDEDFSPAGFFDHRSDFYDFIREIQDFIRTQREQAKRQGYEQGKKDGCLEALKAIPDRYGVHSNNLYDCD